MPNCRKGAFPGRTVIKQRILTGVVLLPLLILFIVYAGAPLFQGFVCVVSLLALLEFYAMALPQGGLPARILGALAGTALIPALLSGQTLLFQGVLVAAVLLLGIAFLFSFREIASVAPRVALAGFGWLYVPLLLGHLALLRDLPDGRQWVFLVLLVVMASDTAAYFSGVSLGRRKLYPSVSPNKSVEGAIGGLLGSVGGAFLARLWFFPALTSIDCLCLGLLLGVLAQIGDLFESLLKRSFGVKDSGTMIPGHGGLLDRLDSLLFAFPPAYYYAVLVAG